MFDQGVPQYDETQTRDAKIKELNREFIITLYVKIKELNREIILNSSWEWENVSSVYFTACLE